MLREVNEPIWNKHPHYKCEIGYIDKENKFILLAEGEDPDGAIFALWIPTENNKLFIIDKVAKKNGRWTYNRQFESDNLNDISDKFLKIINPDYLA